VTAGGTVDRERGWRFARDHGAAAVVETLDEISRYRDDVTVPMMA
jgi:hypothetical protein